jgi:hypothetical protein
MIDPMTGKIHPPLNSGRDGEEEADVVVISYRSIGAAAKKKGGKDDKEEEEEETDEHLDAQLKAAEVDLEVANVRTAQQMQHPCASGCA